MDSGVGDGLINGVGDGLDYKGLQMVHLLLLLSHSITGDASTSHSIPVLTYTGSSIIIGVTGSTTRFSLQQW